MILPVPMFLDRLAYLRWLRNRGRVKAETDAELAAAWDVGEKWLGKWKQRADPPPGRTELTSIARAIGPEATAWLYDGTGEPPEPDTWKEWYAAWHKAQLVHPAERAPRLKVKPAKEPATPAKKRA